MIWFRWIGGWVDCVVSGWFGDVCIFTGTGDELFGRQSHRSYALNMAIVRCTVEITSVFD